MIKGKKIIALALTAIMAFQSLAVTGFAAENDMNAETSLSTETSATDVTLQNGSAFIPADADGAQIKQILFDALIVNKEGVDPQSLNWEYYGTASSGIIAVQTSSAWADVVNGKSWSQKFGFSNYNFNLGSIATQGVGDIQVRLTGTETAVTLTKLDKKDSSIVVNSDVTIALPYDENGNIVFSELYKRIFDNVVKESTPVLSLDDVTIKYYCTTSIGTNDWSKLEGEPGTFVTFPAISQGNQNIKIAFAGNSEYKPYNIDVMVNFTDREPAPYTLNEPFGKVKLTVDESLTPVYDGIEEKVFNAIIASSDVIALGENTKIEYYATAETGSLGSIGKNWAPLTGATISGLTYPGIPEGTQKVRIIWGGNSQYAKTIIDAEIEVTGRPYVEFTQKTPGTTYDVGLIFTENQGYDYAKTAENIYNTVISSIGVTLEDGTVVSLGFDDVKVLYNTDPTGILPNFVELNSTDITGLIKFGMGQWTIRISTPDTKDYRGSYIDVTVNMADNRIASSVAVKSDLSTVYSKDANVIKQFIFDNVIDWETSELPAKENLSINDFKFEYKATPVIAEGIPTDRKPAKNWAPIEGGYGSELENALFSHNSIGAGENQEIRVTFKGNIDYRPSEKAVATMTVKKAPLKLRVRLTNIHVGDKLPENLITLNPADENIDVFTVFTGMTSDVNAVVYISVPDSYKGNTVVNGLLDPVLKTIIGKSLTEIFNDGISFGQLKQLITSPELLDLLDVLGIDTSALRQIVDIINKLPSVADGLKIAFGTPVNTAGLYNVTAVSASKNYRTAIGSGALLVRAITEGVKIQWNQALPGYKISKADASEFDFDATLTVNGEAVSDSNISYLYTGMTSKWRPYSSTTTAPTEPGRYVMTVVTLGGNYIATPVTRSFQITK